jgi:hypothetical protein
MGWVSTAIADEVSTAATSAWIVPFVRDIPSARSRALVMLWPRLPGPDLAEALQLRDVLLLGRDVLLGAAGHHE